MTLLSDAFTAYLGPLLNKHSSGAALVWEDLEASHAASLEVLKNSGNSFVSKKVDDLHQSQIRAYREAAMKALRQWAQSEAPLEPMEDDDTEDSFVDRCIRKYSGPDSSSLWPNWNLHSAKMVVILELRKRARATFAKYHPSGPDDNDKSNMDEGGGTTADSKPNDKANANASDATANINDPDPKNEEDDNHDGDGDDDDGDEDGEMVEDDEADGPVEAETSSAAAKASNSNGGPKAAADEAGSTKKKVGNTNAKNKTNNNKKVVARKKATNVKQAGQARKGGPSNRGRRPGRGGGAAGAAKSG